MVELQTVADCKQRNMCSMVGKEKERKREITETENAAARS